MRVHARIALLTFTKNRKMWLSTGIRGTFLNQSDETCQQQRAWRVFQFAVEKLMEKYWHTSIKQQTFSSSINSISGGWNSNRKFICGNNQWFVEYIHTLLVFVKLCSEVNHWSRQSFQLIWILFRVQVNSLINMSCIFKWDSSTRSLGINIFAAASSRTLSTIIYMFIFQCLIFRSGRNKLCRNLN